MRSGRPMKVGLTGGIGSGKSTVCRVLRILGVEVFDADEEARKLMNDDAGSRAEVMARFGPGLYSSGQLDRKSLAAMVFGDTKSLADLNGIVHPHVRSAFAIWADDRKAHPYVVMEAAILLGSPGAAQMDRIVAVTCPAEERRRRVMLRDGLDAGEVAARMKHQLSDEAMAQGADMHIVNDGNHLVIPQVLSLHQSLLERSTQ
ncbi:MAG: dephospho-CoA kinase [Flavobacteriales bacterium]